MCAGMRIFFLKTPDLEVRLRPTVRHPRCQCWILTRSERPVVWLGRRPRTARRPPAGTECFETQSLIRPCVGAPSFNPRMTTWGPTLTESGRSAWIGSEETGAAEALGRYR